MLKKVLAVIRTQWEGYHCWPDAPEEVKFLRDLHRHLFHITVRIEQFHNERDIEYIMFLRRLRDNLEANPIPETASCETIASVILAWIHLEYPGREASVEVSEDGENGAIVLATN